MSLRDNYRQDPAGQHWKNPYLDSKNLEFCGHCGDNWPCEAVRRALPGVHLAIREISARDYGSSHDQQA